MFLSYIQAGPLRGGRGREEKIKQMRAEIPHIVGGVVNNNNYWLLLLAKKESQKGSFGLMLNLPID